MELITIPIIDYLTLCKNLAAQRGFKWVMVLMARERDAIKSYEDIKKYWDSYNDLTSEKILFVFSLANKQEESYNRHPAFEKECWVRVFNPQLLIMNDTIPSISTWDSQSQNIVHNYRNVAIDNHTQNISDLCREYDISESQIPSLLLFNVHSHMPDTITEKPIILPLINDDLYGSIKKLLLYLEPFLKRIKCSELYYEKLRNELKEVRETISNAKLSSQEIRYLRANSFLQNVSLPKETRSQIQHAIETLDLKICHTFSQPLRGCINQIISLLIVNKNIQYDIEQKNLKLIDISNKEAELKNKLIAAEKEKCNAYRSLDQALLDFIEGINQEKIMDNAIIIKENEVLTEELRTKKIYITKK